MKIKLVICNMADNSQNTVKKKEEKKNKKKSLLEISDCFKNTPVKMSQNL